MEKVKLLITLMLGTKVYEADSVIEVTPQHAQELVNKNLAVNTGEAVNEVVLEQKKTVKTKKAAKKPVADVGGSENQDIENGQEQVASTNENLPPE